MFAYTTGSLPQVNNYITMSVCVILLLNMRGKYSDKRNTVLEKFFKNYITMSVCVVLWLNMRGKYGKKQILQQVNVNTT